MKSFIADLVPQYLTPQEAIKASFVEEVRELRDHILYFTESGLEDDANMVMEITNHINIPQDFREAWRKYKDIITGLHAGVMSSN
jgi:hypothetical protein